jgi:hypothetical protein
MTKSTSEAVSMELLRHSMLRLSPKLVVRYFLKAASFVRFCFEGGADPAIARMGATTVVPTCSLKAT